VPLVRNQKCELRSRGGLKRAGIHNIPQVFLFSSLLAAASGSARALVPMSFGTVPSLKAAGYKSFNEKLNIAAVGVGGRGAQNLSNLLSENIVALCDVDSRQGAPTFKRFDKTARYVDFRRMLDKEGKNIDAVVISTADHMHATIALWCMERGKHETAYQNSLGGAPARRSHR
jgi:hypothetical protein